MAITRKLKMGEVLEYCDHPLLFLATDRVGSTHVCVYLKNTPTHSEFLCTELNPTVLASLLAGKVDLRTALLDAAIQDHRLAKVVDAEDFTAEPISTLREMLELPLPAPDYYVNRKQ